MSILKYIGAAALILTMVNAWAGDEPAAAESAAAESAAAEKPYIYASQSLMITAVVEAIDQETRVVTLRGPQGNSVTFTVTEEARNLGQVKAGDLVDVEYLQEISIEVMANPGLAPGAGELAVAARSPEGDMPGMAVVDTQVITATVEEINLEANTFKLKGPEGNVEEFTARNPENLKLADVGDLVVITYTEAMAIAVEHAKAE